MSRLIFMALLVSAFGCDDRHQAGGSTGDFTGDVGQCRTTSEPALDDDSLLGFSGQQVLDFSVGRYEVAIRWSDACESRAACSSEGTPCQSPPDTTGLVGTDTQFVLDVEPHGSRAKVIHAANESERPCGQFMLVPARVRLSSEDGAFYDEVFDVEISTALGETADIRLRAPVESLNGALASPELGLSQDAELAMVFGFYGDEFWLETYVNEGQRTVLTDLLLPADDCVLSLPRSEVDVTDPDRAPPR
jgi:hypothetical protein